MIGQTLAHYEILELLGKGGMGEVYRARDTKLDREVALKLLHAEVARDPERLARFRREAKVLASLNHPNIASLHGIEEVDGRVFLVMELVEGSDLSERIGHPVPVDEATRIAAELARGLEKAHDQGIVHRDLKPSNIKITPEGQVKILDFGLARVYSGDETSSTDLENSPTITAAFTAAGVILGTAAYMSPEQARGRAVDKRTDIWAFGVVVWEMLTGERLFAGETVSDTLAAVLTRELDPVKLPRDLPQSFRHLLARCLERDHRLRLRDIGEARLLLEHPETLQTTTGPGMAEEATARSPRRTILMALPWILLVAALAWGLPHLGSGPGRPGDQPRVRRFEVLADLPRLYNTRAVEIAPDGSSIAVFARDGLLIRKLDDTTPRLLVPADELDYNETGITPFWSPDSEYIGYASKGRLWKIPAAGGSPSVICTLPGGWNGGAWGDDGIIVICTARGPMYSVPARGGDPTLLIGLDENEELDFHQPTFVSDGGGFVYSVHRLKAVDTIELYRAGQRTVLLRVDDAVRGNVQLLNNPVYSPTGHILYQRDQGNQGLWALPFDADRGVATGAPFLVQSGAGHPSVSHDGTLIEVELAQGTSGQLVVVSRAGAIVEALTDDLPGLAQPAFSPTGRSVAYSATPELSQDVFVVDRDTKIVTRLILSGDDEGYPAWIPGSDRIAYVAPYEGGCSGAWAISADGRGQPELLAPNCAQPTFGPEGLDLVATTQCAKERGLVYFRLGSDQEPKILRAHPAGVEQPEISPDGRHISYLTWQDGSPLIEVADFPAMTGRRLVVRSESRMRWSRDGSEVYYVEQEPARLVASGLEPGDAFTIRSTDVLFELEGLGIANFSEFDATGDGTEFVFVRANQDRRRVSSFTVVENWFEAFREH